MRHFSIAFALVLAFAVSATAHENWCGYDFVQIGVPNRDGDPLKTVVNDINNRGEVIGFNYHVADGFRLLPSDYFHLRGSVVRPDLVIPGRGTLIARSINNAGQIAGAVGTEAVVLEPSGEFRTFTVPASIRTGAEGISNTGVVVGTYTNPLPVSPVRNSHGFIWDGVTVTRIDASFSDNNYTIPRGINRAGHVVGYVLNNRGERPKAFRYANGVLTPFDLPGQDTDFQDINDRGEIVGNYNATLDMSAPPGTPRPNHAFVLEPTGEMVPIEAPFPNVGGTRVNGINNHGDIVGYVLGPPVSGAANAIIYGFTATPRICTAAEVSTGGLDQ